MTEKENDIIPDVINNDTNSKDSLVQALVNNFRDAFNSHDPKVFATYLRNKGIEPEIIDLLQGRISRSVFVNHYYKPDINVIITKKIRPVLELLRNELIG
jgi:hypothetical protein